ncbi:MAG: ArsA-related P-loop ATPase, partial [Vicinamibacterales bacterium]
SVGAIVANRVLPVEADGLFLQARREQERRYLADVDRLLGRFPIARVPQFAQDVQGIPALQLVGQALTRSGG